MKSGFLNKKIPLTVVGMLLILCVILSYAYWITLNTLQGSGPKLVPSIYANGTTTTGSLDFCQPVQWKSNGEAEPGVSSTLSVSLKSAMTSVDVKRFFDVSYKSVISKNYGGEDAEAFYATAVTATGDIIAVGHGSGGIFGATKGGDDCVITFTKDNPIGTYPIVSDGASVIVEIIIKMIEPTNESEYLIIQDKQIIFTFEYSVATA